MTWRHAGWRWQSVSLRACEQSRIGIMTCKLNASFTRSGWGRSGYLPCPLSFGGLVHQATTRRGHLSVRQLTWRRGCLAADCRDPLLGINIPHEESGDFTDARRGACFANDRIAPALVAAHQPCYVRICERGEGIPVRKRQRAWIVQLVFGEFVLALPASRVRLAGRCGRTVSRSRQALPIVSAADDAWTLPSGHRTSANSRRRLSSTAPRPGEIAVARYCARRTERE